MNATDDKPQIVQLCACRMGAAAAIVWGVGMFLMGIITMFTDSYCHEMVRIMGNVYPGYAPGSFGGALLGLIWGALDGFVCVTVAVLIYNALARCGACCCCGGKSPVSRCESPISE